ncbi:MAG: hypothetical protein ACM3U2_11275, partial [Deltaproteobacteria bacterium]
VSLFVCFVCFVVILNRPATDCVTTKHTKYTKGEQWTSSINLKATGFKLGLLVNFGPFPKVAYERIVR